MGVSLPDSAIRSGSVCSSADQIDPFGLVLVGQRAATVNLFDHERLPVERREQFVFAVEGASYGLDVMTQELFAVHLPIPQVGGDDERPRRLEDTVDLGQRGLECPSWKVVDGVERHDARERSRT